MGDWAQFMVARGFLVVVLVGLFSALVGGIVFVMVEVTDGVMSHVDQEDFVSECQRVDISPDGSVYSRFGYVCVTEGGWRQINLDGLTMGEYRRLVVPVVDSLRSLALDEGFYRDEFDFELKWYGGGLR
jgi:hypothetical protein